MRFDVAKAVFWCFVLYKYTQVHSKYLFINMPEWIALVASRQQEFFFGVELRGDEMPQLVMEHNYSVFFFM